MPGLYSLNYWTGGLVSAEPEIEPALPSAIAKVIAGEACIVTGGFTAEDRIVEVVIMGHTEYQFQIPATASASLACALYTFKTGTPEAIASQLRFCTRDAVTDRNVAGEAIIIAITVPVIAIAIIAVSIIPITIAVIVSIAVVIIAITGKLISDAEDATTAILDPDLIIAIAPVITTATLSL